ncbi:ATP-binding protein [Glaciecola siphonariae]|uniref:histidine kinase n=1 Tax=Glaciecola siphonariae TaxID=521012 RepID=A0ABV9LVC9_9ALTE
MNRETKHSSVTWAIITLLFLLLIGINTYIARSTISELNVLQANIRNTGDVMVALDELHISLLTAESGQRGYLLMQQEQDMQHYRQALSRMDEHLKTARALDSDIPGQKARILEVASLIEQMITELEQNVADARDNDVQAIRDSLARGASVELYNEIRALFEQLSAAENEHREKLSSTLQKVTAESRTTFALSLITSLLLVIGIFFLARLNIRFQKQRQREIEEQNASLYFAVEERTQELSIYSEELKRSNRELEDFAFVASHDLQEPLRKIQTFGDRLLSQYGESLGDKGQDYLQRMQSAAMRMSRLISDLLAFSRVSTRGKDFESVSLNQTLDNCVDDLSVTIEELDAHIEVPDLPEIQADPTQMHQLFINLLSNALKFSLPNTPPKIKIEVRKTSAPEHINLPNLEDWFEIKVADNGIGFEQEYADKIFAPFQRLHNRNEYAGTGIGLSICRRIVERHNGEISAKSKVNEGACFSIVLPATNYLNQISEGESDDE